MLRSMQESQNVPPLTWFTKAGLALDEVSRPSFSRAAVRLQQDGFIERGLALLDAPWTGSARELRRPKERVWLVVRLVADDEQKEELRQLRARLNQMPPRSAMHYRYSNWLNCWQTSGAVSADYPWLASLSAAGGRQEAEYLMAQVHRMNTSLLIDEEAEPAGQSA